MSDPLYAKELLRLAANAIGAGRLDPFDAEGVAHNPTCGDKVSVTLRLDEHGRVTGIAHETNACVLAQASSSILGAQLMGADRQAVQDLRAAVEAMLHDGAAAGALCRLCRAHRRGALPQSPHLRAASHRRGAERA